MQAVTDEGSTDAPKLPRSGEIVPHLTRPRLCSATLPKGEGFDTQINDNFEHDRQNDRRRGFPAAVLGLRPKSKRKEKEKAGLLAQVQEFLRIHGLVIVGDTEVDMAAQS